LSMAVHAGNRTAVTDAVLAPGLIGLWLISISLAGQVINEDRATGRFELLIGAPVSFSAVLLGRLLVVIPVGMLTLVESWLVAAVGFGRVTRVADPALFLLGFALTCFAMVGTATLLATLFVLSRALELFQSLLTYPVYILGGVLVPTALLPGWLRTVSRLMFLSWSSDLLRDTIRGTDRSWFLPAAAIALLGGAALVAGIHLTHRVVDRARRSATVGQT
jgi:ABC-2 type transport system permease protein